MRDKIENVEKETRMRMLQRSVGHSHSRDSAIDTDLQVKAVRIPSLHLHSLKPPLFGDKMIIF